MPPKTTNKTSSSSSKKTGRGGKRKKDDNGKTAETPARKSKAQAYNSKHYTKTPKANVPVLGPAINAVFDQYRDDPANNPDTINVEGAMKFLTDIGINIEEPASIAIHHLLGAESMGELERAGFVKGWEARGADGVAGMRAAAASMRASLAADPAYFRDVYRHAFLLGRAPGQKSAQLDTALELWRLMFGPGALPWKTSAADWLGAWLAFIAGRGPKVVSRDLWNQTEVFARKSLADETLGFWSEESSWPTIIDDFVHHIKEKGTAMEVE